MPHSQTRRQRLETVSGLIEAIRELPSDPEVPKGTRGYNRYTTQRAHWLGWLGDTPGTGSYQRSSDNDARRVYNRIVEPQMLLWLAEAAGVEPQRVATARRSAAVAGSLASQSKAIREHVPYSVLADALWAGATRGAG